MAGRIGHDQRNSTNLEDQDEDGAPLWLVIVVAAMCCVGTRPAAACTGIRILPKDGAVICARTLEFAVELQVNVLVIPRDRDYVGTAPATNPASAGR